MLRFFWQPLFKECFLERPVQIQRTHDKEIYTVENRYENPKEVTRKLTSLVLESSVLKKGSKIADVGCAAGEFLFHLQRSFPDAQYTGYDPVPELLEKARQVVPKVTFKQGSVLDRGMIEKHSQDVVFLQGVHSIFDEIEPCFGNLIEWTKPGGRVYVFGPFNPNPVDVFVKYHLHSDPNPNHLEPGWNIFSRASVSKFVDSKVGPGKHRYIPFEMSNDLPRNSEDPVRSWTFQDNQSRRLFTNGLCLLLPLEILEISV